MSTAFVFHSRQHAAAALSAASRTARGVTLLTPPGAARHGGPEYLLAMIRSARPGIDEVEATAVIDCGDDAGTAMRALRCGWRNLALRARPEVVEKVSDMALQLGGVVRRDLPSALDLLSARDPLLVCVEALEQETNSPTEETR